MIFSGRKTNRALTEAHDKIKNMISNKKIPFINLVKAGVSVTIRFLSSSPNAVSEIIVSSFMEK